MTQLELSASTFSKQICFVFFVQTEIPEQYETDHILHNFVSWFPEDFTGISLTVVSGACQVLSNV